MSKESHLEERRSLTAGKVEWRVAGLRAPTSREEEEKRGGERETGGGGHETEKNKKVMVKRIK